MNYNLDIPVFDFSLIRGESETIRFTKWEKINSQGLTEPWILTGLDIRVHFKSDFNQSQIDMELKAPGGIIISGDTLDLIFDKSTLDLKKDRYFYDILIIQNGERNILVRGTMTLTGVVTI